MTIKFVDTDPILYEKQLIEAYEMLAGRSLHPADPERLIINLLTYALTVTAINIDETGRQNLLAYARGEYLDAIAELYGITRLPAKPAITNLRFTLKASLPYDAVIPKGTRVAPDGNIVFKTIVEAKITANSLSVEVQAECEESGRVGNGFVIGQINKLIDPLPYDIMVENINMSMYGADVESDERFRERLRGSLERFTNAGSKGAYIFHTLSVHQDILDVEVFSPEPGQVKVVFLMKNGELPDSSTIEQVKNYLSGEKIKPLTDLVIVSAPEVVNYQVSVQYYINKKDELLTYIIQQNVQKAVNDFIALTGSKIGRDVLPEELTAMIKNAGAYRVIINSPSFVELQHYQIAKAETVNITYLGLTED